MNEERPREDEEDEEPEDSGDWMLLLGLWVLALLAPIFNHLPTVGFALLESIWVVILYPLGLGAFFVARGQELWLLLLVPFWLVYAWICHAAVRRKSQIAWGVLVLTLVFNSAGCHKLLNTRLLP